MHKLARTPPITIPQTVLTSLDLSSNKFGSKGMIFLSEALLRGGGVRDLDIRQCALGDAGAVSFLHP